MSVEYDHGLEKAIIPDEVNWELWDRKPNWIIYYKNGAIFSDLHGSEWDAPRWGVLYVFCYDPEDGRGYSPLFDTDFYCWHEEYKQWSRHDKIDHYLEHEKHPLVLQGYSIPVNQWRPALGMASKLLPPKE